MRLWKLRARRAPAPAVMHQLGVQRLALVVFILMMTWLLYRLILLLHDRRKAERESIGASASVPRWRRRSSLRADHAWIRRLSGETAGEALDIVDSRRSTSGDCTPASEATITGDDVSDDDKQRDREAPKSTRRTLVFTPPTPPLKRRQSAPELVCTPSSLAPCSTGKTRTSMEARLRSMSHDEIWDGSNLELHGSLETESFKSREQRLLETTGEAATSSELRAKGDSTASDKEDEATSHDQAEAASPGQMERRVSFLPGYEAPDAPSDAPPDAPPDNAPLRWSSLPSDMQFLLQGVRPGVPAQQMTVSTPNRRFGKMPQSMMRKLRRKLAVWQTKTHKSRGRAARRLSKPKKRGRQSFADM